MVVYEWDVETLADGESEDYEDGEVIDHHHTETYAQAVQVASQNPEAGIKYAIVLVRDDDNQRAWAYMEDGKLPEFFTDADGCDYCKVPQRFIQEVSRHA